MPAVAKQPKEPKLASIEPERLPGLLIEHTGRRSEKDHRLVKCITEGLSQSLSIRSICERYHVDHNTVVAIRQLMEANGQLPAFKQRIQAGFAGLLEEGTEQTLESIRSGKKKLTCYDLGVLYDRHSHMMGEPSLRVDVEVHGPRLDELTKLLTGPVVDVESSVSPAQVTITDVVGLNSGQTLPSVSGQTGGRGVETAGGHEDGDGI